MIRSSTEAFKPPVLSSLVTYQRITYKCIFPFIVTTLKSGWSGFSSCRAIRRWRSSRSTPAGRPVSDRFVFDSYRLTWYWRFPQRGKWSFRLGATLKVRDAQIALAGAAGRSAKDDLGLVPLVYLGARYQATERFALELAAFVLIWSWLQQRRSTARSKRATSPAA